MDIFGMALSDYHYKSSSDILWLHNSYSEPEEMPVDVFFRSEEDMPALELLALECCRGKILDIGAGAGSHSLKLQDEGKNVTALEISSVACSVMRSRGVHQIINGNIFTYKENKFDTLLLMMNGIGLCGSVNGLRNFLKHSELLLNQGGQIVFDSSDIAYLYENDEFPTDVYYGEITYQYEYKGEKGALFSWLYIDWHTLSDIAREEGWTFRLLHEDDQDQYLASLEKI